MQAETDYSRYPILVAEALTKIFDPYYSTKPPDKGTGLGLFLAYGIVREQGGRLWVENNDGDGASFYIELPVKSEPVCDGIPP